MLLIVSSLDQIQILLLEKGTNSKLLIDLEGNGQNVVCREVQVSYIQDEVAYREVHVTYT